MSLSLTTKCGGGTVMAKSNTSRTLEYLRQAGWQAGMVERWVRAPGRPGGGIRIDLFNFLDIVAMGDGKIIGVQSTGQAFSEHDKKILAEPRALTWIECGGRLILIGWRRIKKVRGKKAMVWSPRIKEYIEADFTQRWQHEETGRTVDMPGGQIPGPRWYKMPNQTA